MQLPAEMRETGTTSEEDSGLPLERSTGQRIVVGLLSSLVLGLSGLLPLKAAEQLEVQLDGMVIPIKIEDLAQWGKSKPEDRSELSIWLRLLDRESREGLQKLLQAPLLNNRSMARQMLHSWAGLKLLDEISDLVRVDGDSRGTIFLNTLEQLLKQQSQVTAMDLLEALPAERIRIDLDELLLDAKRWYQHIQSQQQLVQALRSVPVRGETMASGDGVEALPSLGAQLIKLRVAHRRDPLPLHLWKPAPSAPSRGGWVALMPGLGGSPDHFRWLAAGLSLQGWPVVVLEHPGSDAKAVQELLEGRRPPPGAEVLPDRLADLKAVLTAHDQGELPLPGERLVLMGHSLGALTAVLAAGAIPADGLEQRCRRALDGLPLTNLSRLLQCQLADVSLPTVDPRHDLQGIVALNSFGSLLWPRSGDASIEVPVLLAGGTLDLITPPASEQLALLLTISSHPASRALLFEGGSHFSPIQVPSDPAPGAGQDLFRLGDELVGIKPQAVQRQLLVEITSFLEQVEKRERLEISAHLEIDGLRLHRLNRAGIERLNLSPQLSP